MSFLTPWPLSLIFLCGEKGKLLGIILFFLILILKLARERERGSKEAMGKFKGMACLLLSFFLSSLLRTCLSWRTRTASLCWRRWWAPPLHHTAPQARVPFSIDHRGAWRMWLACWWDSQSSWSLSSPAPYPPPPPPGEADPWSPSSFNKRQTITNLVFRFPVFLLPPPLLPLSLSQHHHNTCSHTSDRQSACLQTRKPSCMASPTPATRLFWFSITASSSCHSSRSCDLIFFFIFLTTTTITTATILYILLCWACCCGNSSSNKKKKKTHNSQGREEEEYWKELLPLQSSEDHLFHCNNF